MTDSHDASYYKRREAAERHLAEISGEKSIARIHLELADRYAAQAAALPIHSVLLMSR
jgi:hypothetical protein